jgi:hypothetical protein
MSAIFAVGLWLSFEVVAKGLFQNVVKRGAGPSRIAIYAGNLQGFPQVAKDELD